MFKSEALARIRQTPWRASLILVALLTLPSGSARGQSGALAREVWKGLSTNDSTYATTVLFTNTTPTTIAVLSEFESPANYGDGYGQRIRGFVLPPATGSYTFWIASDEWSDLFLSSDEYATNRVRIANVNNATRYHEWNAEPNQKSAAISLEAGRRYYIEAVHKEGSGPDHLSVRWQLPDAGIEEPIPGKAGSTVRLISYKTNVVTAPSLLNLMPSNIVVSEGRPLLVVATANNGSPVNYQWQLNGDDIPEATKSVYSIPAAQIVPNDGQKYRCRLGNNVGTNLTTEVLVVVKADTTPPSVSQVIYLSSTRLRVRFSEPITPASGGDATHFTLDGGVGVSSSTLVDDSTVALTTSAMTPGGTYNLHVSGIQDRVLAPNTIAPNTVITFRASEFSSLEIGAGLRGGGTTQVPGGYDMTVASRDIAGASDQLEFNWQLVSGNFDYRVRVQSLANAVDAWAKGALMARLTLASNSPFVMMTASPGVEGIYFASRAAVGASVNASGSFPLNYPESWLRVRREDNLFRGYASRDGDHWMQIGSIALSAPLEMYLGLALSSKVTNQVMTAQFRDFGPVTSVGSPETLSAIEPSGPSARTGPLAITEIMFQSAFRPDLTNSLEFVELYNSNPFFEDISGYHFEGDINFTFPPGTVMDAGGYLVVAKEPDAIKTVYGVVNVFGPFTGALHPAGQVRLEDKLNAVMLEVPYDNNAPWPVGADGAGHSLVLKRPSYGERNAAAWGISDRKGGSPGRVDAVGAEPIRDVVINELLANSAAPLSDYIELYNRGSRPADLSGAWLSDSPSTNLYRIPNGTVLPSGGHISFGQVQLGFSLRAEGETVYLVNSNQNRVIDAVKFGDQRPNISIGRYPDGGEEWYPLKQTSPADPNGAPLIHDIVINEIMYKPISGDDNDGFVELYNQGKEAVDIGGWKFVAGISYKFPAGAVIPAGGYLVVARDRTNLLAHYAGTLTEQNTFGNYQGKPTKDGDRVALAMPVEHVNVNKSGVTVTNIIYPVVDELTFERGGQWSKWANGDGSSIELRDPRANHRLAYNWGDSDDTKKSQWTSIEATGLVDNSLTWPLNDPINRLEVTLLNAGECLLDDVEVIGTPNGPNLVANSTFESGLGVWTPQGDHVNSTLEATEGHNSGKSLHIRASARGDTGANRIRVALTSAITEGRVCTIRAKVRWLRGWPELVLRLKGNGFELAGAMVVPKNLGTPGARNSIAIDNAPPAISDVHHFPALPAVGENALVTARVQDPDGIKSLNLAYRLDPDTTFTTTPMKDDGTGGDAVAGDGVFSALIPGPGPNTLVAFYVEAVDASPAAQVSRFPVDAPARECLVRFGEPSPSSGFANYHMYLSAKNVSQWINRPSLSNERVEGTFVYGNFRVIYFIGSKYAGSPYHQGFNTPVTDLCHFSIELPLDDTLLGTENFNKLHSPGNGAGDDGLAQREQTCYWMMRQMDLPYNYRRFVAVFVDGNRKGDFMEDTQTPGTDVVAQRFPNDSNGNLYKLQPWFEFDDVQVIAGGAAGFNNNSWCTLVNFYTGPQQNIKKLARYRYNFLTRAANGTANDYTNVWDLTDAANTLPGGDYVANMKRQANMEQWMRTFAVQHSVGNWDSFGNRNSQNMYGYKPTQGKWTIMTWDFNIVLGNSGSDGPTGDDLFQYQTADDAMLRIYQAPEFRRMYWRALKEITDRVMRDPALNALMDAKYAEITASGRGGSVQSPADIKTWIAARIPYIANQIKPHLTNFTVLGSAAYETNGSVALLSGSAPLEVDHLTVNGVAYPLTWFNPPGTKEIMVTAWRMQVPLAPGDNTLLIQGVDRNGVPIPGLFQVNHVKRTTDLVPPEGRVVINEILYNGLLPESAFIELHNTSATESYDLSGWRLDGVSYKFPPGALLAPKQFLVLAANSTKFERAFSTIARVFDEFTGNLSDSSEVLSLIKPGDTPAQDIVVDRVRYESALPWSPRVYGTGASLQLIDASQDDSRVSNWTDGAQIQWQKVTATATNRGNRLVLFLPFSGDVFVDDVTLVDTNGVDVAKNGGFESPLAGTWFVSTNSVGSDVSAAVAHSGTSSLHLFSKGPGQSSTNFSVWQVTQPILTNSTYTLSFWFLPGPNAVAVVGRTLPSGPLFVSNSVAPMFATPGLPNTVAAPLPAYPPLWLNEVLPYNQNGLADNQGDKDPWIEIYNAGKEALDLTGYFVSDDYGQLKKWAFPAGTTIQAGQFLVIWGDGEPEATAPGFIHTSFSISPTNGAVVLSREIPGGPQIIDYINYPRLDADQAFGSFPDGQPFYRQKLFHVTPGAGNDATPAPVRINEWMAANSSTLANPAGGKFNDWFELYNPSEQTADLSGYFLSENLGNANQFAIPAGTLIPARDHLLVWADKQSSLNAPGAQDLHANFSLDKKNGGIIALFTPSLAVVDKVSFGKQTNDISMGRFPDGAEDIRFMVHPTPRSPNTLGGDGNTPPTITPIPNMVVNENVRLLFTATAEDAESAPAQLTFTLDPGAPAGALILPDGRFRWRPTEAQGPGSYALSVRVTDSGKPGLSAATSFKIKVDEVNQPPAFDQHAHYGQVGKRLAFATAVDPDLPPQRLGFSLPQGAPVGLTVEPASGVVTWTPTADQVGRHAVVVQAVDDGSPPMSAVYSYLIEVFAAGETVIVSEISRAGNQVTLHCNSAAGKSYQLQYKTDLGAASWTPLGDPKLASGADVQFSDAVSGSRRYYRIIEGP